MSLSKLMGEIKQGKWKRQINRFRANDSRAREPGVDRQDEEKQEMETDTPGGPPSHVPSTASSYGAESIEDETREDEAERERQIQQMVDEAEAKHQTGDYDDGLVLDFQDIAGRRRTAGVVIWQGRHFTANQMLRLCNQASPTTGPVVFFGENYADFEHKPGVARRGRSGQASVMLGVDRGREVYGFITIWPKGTRETKMLRDVSTQNYVLAMTLARGRNAIIAMARKEDEAAERRKNPEWFEDEGRGRRKFGHNLGTGIAYDALKRQGRTALGLRLLMAIQHGINAAVASVGTIAVYDSTDNEPDNHNLVENLWNDYKRGLQHHPQMELAAADRRTFISYMKGLMRMKKASIARGEDSLDLDSAEVLKLAYPPATHRQWLSSGDGSKDILEWERNRDDTTGLMALDGLQKAAMMVPPSMRNIIAETANQYRDAYWDGPLTETAKRLQEADLARMKWYEHKLMGNKLIKGDHAKRIFFRDAAEERVPADKQLAMFEDHYAKQGHHWERVFHITVDVDPNTKPEVIRSMTGSRGRRQTP